MWNKNITIFYYKKNIAITKNELKSNVEQIKSNENYISIYTLWAPSLKKFSKKLPIYMWPLFTYVC